MSTENKKMEQAYFSILSLCLSNYEIDNPNAQYRAKGMYEAIEIMCRINPALPSANLKYLQSLKGIHQDNPTQKSQSDQEQHHWQHLLGEHNYRKFQNHIQSAIQAETAAFQAVLESPMYTGGSDK